MTFFKASSCFFRNRYPPRIKSGAVPGQPGPRCPLDPGYLVSLWFRPSQTRVLQSALLRDSRLGLRRRLARRRRRDREREPHVPALRAMLGAELLVALEVPVALKLGAERYNVADLRPDPEHLRLEAADPVTRSAVAGDLPVGIADEAEL